MKTVKLLLALSILKYLFFLNPKFLLWLYSPVCVGPGRTPRRKVFSRRSSYMYIVYKNYNSLSITDGAKKVANYYYGSANHPLNVDVYRFEVKGTENNGYMTVTPTGANCIPITEVMFVGGPSEYKICRKPDPEIINLFSCSTKLRLKFILLINVKMPTIVAILTFISRINFWLCLFIHEI